MEKTVTYTFEMLRALMADLIERQAETDRQLKETDLKIDKLTENVNKGEQKQAETWQQIDKLTENVNNLNDNVGGIGNSNGDVAEEFFFNAFKNGQQTFFGEKFDDIEKNIKGIKLKAEYDIVMLNGKTIGIIEVKYKGKSEFIPKVIKKAETFRINYPYFANYKIYLALAAMSFEDGVEDKCKKEGIAIIKQAGDKVVINDDNLTIY
jgi:uncharacterized protein YukE